MKKIFYNDKLIFSFIILNVIIIYLHTFDSLYHLFHLFEIIDFFLTLFFMVEITFKIESTEPVGAKSKLRTYFSTYWNQLDFFAILIAVPSIGVLFYNDLEMFAGFTVLRLLRIFKLFRIIEYIPNGKIISRQIINALKSISFIIVAFFIYTTIISLLAVSIFKRVAPEYFHNAFESFFTIFKLFSGDSLVDIITEIQKNGSPFFVAFSKFFFVVIVFTGSMLGIGLIQCILIEQMSLVSEDIVEKETQSYEALKKDFEELKKTQQEILEAIKQNRI